MSDKLASLRKDIVAFAQKMSDSGLSAGKSGNLSARWQNNVLITPTGIDYQQLSPVDIVCIDLQGNVIDSELKPSSEWLFHCAIYQTYQAVNAIVHTHSHFCTALACTQRAIPAFHYMVAEFGSDHVPCADYATFGTEQLAENATAALQQSTACLLAHHGAITTGNTVKQAYESAVNLEALAGQYCEALKIGNVSLLGSEEMQRVLEKFKSYGQQET